MKRLLSALTIAILLSSCAGTYKQSSHVTNNAYIGMPFSEFKRLSGRKAQLEVMEQGYTVYRMRDYDAMSGVIIDTKFFYFDGDAKLVKIDGGEFRQRRYQVEVINR